MEHINDYGQYRNSYIDGTPIDTFKINLTPLKDHTEVSSFDDFLNQISEDPRLHRCVVTKIKSKFKQVNLTDRQPCSEDLAQKNKGEGLVDLLKSIVTQGIFLKVEAPTYE